MKWTFDKIIEAAKPYPSRSTFAKGSSVAYRLALKYGMLPYMYPMETLIVPMIDATTVPVVQHGIRAVKAPKAAKATDMDQFDLNYIDEDIDSIMIMSGTIQQQEIEKARQHWAGESEQHLAHFNHRLEIAMQP
jgi:hypothetical protein